MENFKETIGIINKMITTFCFGLALPSLFTGDYQIAAWILFGTSIMFAVGYFTERWSN